MERLKRSSDRKVANSVTKGGNARIRNAFGLPAKVSCPGATSFCAKICYAARLEGLPTLKNVRDSLAHNWNALSTATYLEMVEMLDDMLIEFERECDKWNADKLFRIHWDGDFFSRTYARAWRTVILAHPNVQFWAYTRSFDSHTVNVLPDLDNVSNLTLYISADPVNMDLANLMAAFYNLPVATVADTFKEAKEASFGGKAYRCPENVGSLPLITEKGSACHRCGVCIDGRGDVLFSVSKS